MNKQVSHIPSGYKPSPLGIIPEDWEVKRLGEVGEVFSGGTPNTEIQEYWNGNIDWCTPTDITLLNGAVYIERTALKITDLGLKSSSAVLLPPNSIIVCTRATIGNAAISLHQIATNQGFKNIVPNENIDTLFLYYTIVNNKIRLIRLGNGSTFLEVSKSDFENLTIPVPPLPEQHRIVSVLSLWDTAIAKQTALIEKLTLRKRGLMQQLLTGKKRLEGFSGEWKTIELGDTLSYIQPTKYLVVNENYNDTYNTPVLTAGKTFILGYTDETTGVFNDLPAIIFDDFTTESKYVTFPFKAKSSAMKILKAHNSNLYFMFCAMQMIKYSIGGHERHWISKYSHLTLKVPSIEEQNTIASVLLQADKEIEIHKQKLAAMQEQKRGLMQVLLTGKRRVK